MSIPSPAGKGAQGSALVAQYERVRDRTSAYCSGLSDADMTVQSMEDASPAKWHLAHTTWFFETFILKPHAPDYRVFHEAYDFLFNSYYEAVGARHARPKRGMITRPGKDEILAYRAHVDDAMQRLLANEVEAAVAELVALGLNHEEQHQELLLTDILHLFAQNPLYPAFSEPQPLPLQPEVGDAHFIAFDGGIYSVGHGGNGFAYDCEGPRHEVLLRPFKLADRLVTNSEWLDFIMDGGYRNAALWLSDGWALVNREGWEAPLYWHRDATGDWAQMSLKGAIPIDPNAPVCHVSYFEADAFARWAGKRLPSEFEWEVAAASVPVTGNFAAPGRPLKPLPAAKGDGLRQMFGDCWEWTQSAFTAYPCFRPAEGAVGEYNGKFMCGQFVLRGGSCATPEGHIRATYRNFFYPHQRWQFMGLRLAEDVE